MSLVLAAREASLAERIQDRIAEGASIREIAVEDIPFWLAMEIRNLRAVRHVFRSEHALVAITEDGRTIVRRTRV
jgi:hypothetical protein